MYMLIIGEPKIAPKNLLIKNYRNGISMDMFINVNGMYVLECAWWGASSRGDLLDLMARDLTKSLPDPCTPGLAE